MEVQLRLALNEEARQAGEGMAPMRALEDVSAAPPAPPGKQPPPPPPAPPVKAVPNVGGGPWKQPAPPAAPPLKPSASTGAGVSASTGGAGVQASTGAGCASSSGGVSSGGGVPTSSGVGMVRLMEVSRRLEALQKELQHITGEVNTLQQIVADLLVGEL